MAPLNQNQIRLKQALAKKPKTKMLSGFALKPSAGLSKPKPLPQPLPLPAVPSRRRVRFLFEDPDATDSDSDGDESSPASSKRYFEVFVGKAAPSKTVTPAAPVAGACANSGSAADGYRGVRLRKWGKYAAEIRNPFTNKRDWLGTFDTADAASAAYQTASRNFIEEKRRRRGEQLVAATPAPTSSSSSSTSAVHPSPSSVLEATKPAAVEPEPVSPVPTPVARIASPETEQLPDDPEFYQDLLRGLQLPDIDPMDFRAGLDALDVSEVPCYLDSSHDMLLGEFADEELHLDDIGDDLLELAGCDLGRGMDDFLLNVNFCV